MAIRKNCRIEPDNETSIELDSQFLKGFEKAGWLEIIMKFFCYSIEVTIAFSNLFDGNKVVVGGVQWQIDEEFIIVSMGLSNEGEKWVKHTPLKDVP